MYFLNEVKECYVYRFVEIGPVVLQIFRNVFPQYHDYPPPFVKGLTKRKPTF